MGLMKYLLLVVACAGLLGLGVLTLWGGLTVSQEGLFVVRVPHDFPTIQQAVDAVAEGGTVLIGPGLYKENVQITKSIRVIGASQEHVRIQAVDEQKPVFYVTAKAPMQVYLQGLTLSRERLPDLKEPFTFIPPGTGVFILGPIQAIMQQLTITNSSTAVVIFPFVEIDESLLRFQPQIVLEEVALVHNGAAVGALSAQVTIVRSNIAENESGFMGDSLYLTQSTVRKNRFWGVNLHLFRSALGYGPRYIGALEDNDISENGVGVILGAISEDAAGSWLWMSRNKIARNQEYGVMVLNRACPTSFTHPEFSLESALIRVFGGNNELSGNIKGDLCPPDYPWPPGFRR
jgi:hypothetical protein